MSTEDDLRQLHDRATRGAVLSEAERAELEAWYARQDQEERAALDRASVAPSVAELRDQVDATTVRARAVAERIEQLTTANDSLRKEVAALQRQLAQKPAAHAP